FTIDDPVTVIPVRNLTLTAGGHDRTADLRAGRGVALLPADSSPGEALISLDLAAPVPDGWLSLLMDLDTPSVPPSWSQDAAGVPPPAQLTWSYPDVGPAPLDTAQIQDGTQGLRRAGIVRLRVPDPWKKGAGVRS